MGLNKPRTPEELMNYEKQLYEYKGEDKMISSHELAEQLKQVENSVFKRATGISSMDRILGEVEAGELIVISGPSGSGKTTLMMTITQNMANNKVLSAWFTLEVTPRQFIQKMIARGSPLPLFYTPAKNSDQNIQWLIERIIEAKLKYNIQVVFVDHLHQIFSIDKMAGRNLSLEIGDIVARIKQLATDYNITVFLVAHNTDDKVSPNREPKMMDIRDSGLVSRLADSVIGVWKIPNSEDGTSNKMRETDEYDTRAKVRIWKNRRTGIVGWWLMNCENHYLTEIDKLK